MAARRRRARRPDGDGAGQQLMFGAVGLCSARWAYDSPGARRGHDGRHDGSDRSVVC